MQAALVQERVRDEAALAGALRAGGQHHVAALAERGLGGVEELLGRLLVLRPEGDRGVGSAVGGTEDQEAATHAVEPARQQLEPAAKIPLARLRLVDELPERRGVGRRGGVLRRPDGFGTMDVRFCRIYGRHDARSLPARAQT